MERQRKHIIKDIHSYTIIPTNTKEIFSMMMGILAKGASMPYEQILVEHFSHAVALSHQLKLSRGASMLSRPSF
ncbi:MAG: hypothetical protein R2865_03130 [Deinococcales bacterium]